MTSEITNKIAQVTAMVGTFQAEGKNRQQNYDYITADQVLTRVGGAMADVRLVVVPSVTGIDVTPVNYKNGEYAIRYDVTAFMEMAISAGDESIPRTWVGIGSDYSSPDKALSKAITTGHKYFLMKLFNIGVGNPDGEHDDTPPPDNGNKPFYAAMHKKIGYFRDAKHVQNTMNLLSIDYPQSKDEAAGIQIVLESYADLRANGLGQDEAVERMVVTADPDPLFPDEPGNGSQPILITDSGADIDGAYGDNS